MAAAPDSALLPERCERKSSELRRLPKRGGPGEGPAGPLGPPIPGKHAGGTGRLLHEPPTWPSPLDHE